MDLEQRFLGCLVGCAVGDALGAPYEGLWGDCIPEKDQLLSGFAEFEGYPNGQYTDDTQLTLATIESIVEKRNIDINAIAQKMFVLWKTQAVVGPGGACTAAADQFLQTGDWQTCGADPGQAGNGTAMRMAAVGLYFVSNPQQLPDSAASIAQVTHRDPRSIAGGVAIAKAAQLLVQETFDNSIFCEQIAITVEPYDINFAQHIRELVKYYNKDIEEISAKIAWTGMHSPEFSTPIITPFVIPTVLASLWAILKYHCSWGEAVAQVIKLGGDVDTLGAIVGALMGTHLGFSAIPDHLVASVPNSQYIQKLAKQYFIVVQQL